MNKKCRCGTILKIRKSYYNYNEKRVMGSHLYCDLCSKVYWFKQKWKKFKKKNKQRKLKNVKDRETYRIYLKSNRWKNRRLRYFKKHLRICYCCGNISENLHHNSYANIGYEKDSQLVPVCKDCHTEIHNLILNNIEVKLKKAHIIYKQLLSLKI